MRWIGKKIILEGVRGGGGGRLILSAGGRGDVVSAGLRGDAPKRLLLHCFVFIEIMFWRDPGGVGSTKVLFWNA